MESDMSLGTPQQNANLLSLFDKYAKIKRWQRSAISFVWQPLWMPMEDEQAVEQLHWMNYHRKRLMSISDVFSLGALDLMGQYASPWFSMTLDRL
jgi:hypothetical protein